MSNKLFTEQPRVVCPSCGDGYSTYDIENYDDENVHLHCNDWNDECLFFCPCGAKSVVTFTTKLVEE